MSALASLANLKANIAATKAAALKKATDSGAPADPTDAGTVAIPKQPDAEDPGKIGAPPGSKSNTNPTDDTNRQSIGLDQTKPGPTGTDVPAVADGTAADAAATASMGKSAALLNNIAATRAKLGLPATKGASAAAAPAAPAAGAAPAAAGAAENTNVTVEGAMKQASEIFRQVGEIVCETEEGRAMAQQLIAKKAGQNRALELLQQSKQAAVVYERAGAMYAEEQQKRAAEEQAVVRAFEALPPAKQAMARKLARITQAEKFNSPDEYAWFIKGAAMMEDALAAQGGGDPAGGGGAPDLSQLGMDGGDGELSPEAMLQVIEQLVAQGILPEEEAQKIVQQLLGGGGDAAGGDPSGAPGGDAPPQNADDAAAAKEAAALIASLGAVPDIDAVAASFASAK